MLNTRVLMVVMVAVFLQSNAVAYDSSQCQLIKRRCIQLNDPMLQCQNLCEGSNATGVIGSQGARESRLRGDLLEEQAEYIRQQTEYLRLQNEVLRQMLKKGR